MIDQDTARQDMYEQMAQKNGFIAALDQSGGSTPKALQNYGIDSAAYNDSEDMFSLIHDMRTRIITSPAFTGDKVIGAILFERTMDSTIKGIPTAQYLWDHCRIVPFLKVDQGLAEQADGVQRMKPMPNLDALCEKAVSKGIFGTKMRSTINAANVSGIAANVEQQFQIAGQISNHGLMPIIEPEINIAIPDKAEAEHMLRAQLINALDALPDGRQVMLKLSLPSQPDYYRALITHPKVIRVVALSGGYTQAQANAILQQNPGMIASFSRALTEGLSARQNDDDFDAALAKTIENIYAASCA